MSRRSGKLSRAGFDIIVLSAILIVGGSFAAYRFWPTGCSDRNILDQAEDSMRRELGAEHVSFHLIAKVSRSRNELTCVATARVEFKLKASEYHDVAYQAHLDDAGRPASVKAAVKPPQE